MKKIIIVNLIIIICLFCILEFASYLYLANDAKSYMKSYNEYAKKNNLPLLTQRYKPILVFNQNEYAKNAMRKINIGSSKKPSILFFGCSYMYGMSVDEEHTIPYIVNKQTNRTTINRGMPGGNILNTIYDLTDEDFYKTISKYNKPDYIIYLYITDHLNRIEIPYRSIVNSTNANGYEIYPKTKFKNNKVIIRSRPWLINQIYGLYITKAFFYLFAQSFSEIFDREKIIRYFKYAKKITDEKFPNSKFIIIEYKDGGHTLMPVEIKKALINDGFIILNSEELAGHELDSEQYRAEDKEHPSYAAFKDVSDGLIKTLKL